MSPDKPEPIPVLVVDPDERFEESVVSLLMRMDTRLAIQIADTVEEACLPSVGGPPDVLVTEFRLPDGGAEEVIDTLRARRADLPVILATGAVDHAERLAERYEDVHVLAKPFFANTLHGLILQLALEGRRSQAMDGEDEPPEDLDIRPPDGFTGAFAGISLLDLVQFHLMRRKRAALHVHQTDTEQHGWVFFDGGRIVHAVCGAQQGREAFFTMLSWPNGTFLPADFEAIEAPTIDEDPQDLIREALMCVDEMEQMGVATQSLTMEPVLPDLSTVTFSEGIDIGTLIEAERRIQGQVQTRAATPSLLPPEPQVARLRPRSGGVGPTDLPATGDGALDERAATAIKAHLRGAGEGVGGFVGAVLFDPWGNVLVNHGTWGSRPPSAMLRGFERAAGFFEGGDASDPDELTEVQLTLPPFVTLVLPVSAGRLLAVVIDRGAGNAGQLRLVATRLRLRVMEVLRQSGAST